jgi:hypothetical protein
MTDSESEAVATPMSAGSALHPMSVAQDSKQLMDEQTASKSSFGRLPDEIIEQYI